MGFFVVEGGRNINGVMKVYFKGEKGKMDVNKPRLFFQQRVGFLKTRDCENLIMRTIVKIVLHMPVDRNFTPEQERSTLRFLLNKAEAWFLKHNVVPDYIFEIGGEFYLFSAGFFIAVYDFEEVSNVMPHDSDEEV